MSSSQESDPNMTPQTASGGQPQSSLVQLFAETLPMLARYLVIVYPIFFCLILIGLLFNFVIPNQSPDFGQWNWWVICLGIVSIVYLCQAGWNMMMYKAVEDWQTFKKDISTVKPSSPEKLEEEGVMNTPFVLLKAFFPGVGEYGPSFLVGGFLWVLIMAIPIAIIMWVGYTYIGIPSFLTAFQPTSQLSPQDIQNIVDKLPAIQQNQLNEWGLLAIGAMILIAILNGLTYYWQQYLIIKQCNPFKAFIYSASQALHHPLRTILIMLFFGLLGFTFLIFQSLPSFLAFIGSFLSILATVYFGLFMFLYIAQQVNGQEQA